METSITTVNGEKFSHQDSCNMAYMIYKRFGKDIDSAHSAWCRMLQNNCTVNQFIALIKSSEYYY